MKKLISKLAIMAALFSLAMSPAAGAAFAANNLMDDLTFDNVNSMSASQIDAWLNTFPSSCISPNHGFSAVDPVGYNPSQGFLYGGNVSAGRVIYDSAQAYGINPQVLLTTLQKEESLVGGESGCSTLRYTSAVGYACPDGGSSYSYSGVSLYTLNGTTVTSVSGTCVNKAADAGFSQQVIHAAWLLKFGEQRSEGNTAWNVQKPGWDNSDDPPTCYYGPMTQGSFKRCSSDSSATSYDGYTVIDGSSTHMDNGATAAFYWYTPHFSGNQSFDNIFNQYFGSQYSFDSYTAHPAGTLISSGGRIYKISNDGGPSVKQWIAGVDVFYSYGYSWGQVKAGTSGDANLPTGANIASLAPGTIFKSDNTPVYIMTYQSGVLVKQQISYSAFTALGYSWNEVVYVSPGSVPSATASGILFASQHPAGTIVADYSTGKVYLLDSDGSGNQIKRWILGPYAFSTNNYSWGKVKAATANDLALTTGPTVSMRQGAMLLSGGIYVIDYDTGGVLKRPVGPWECFANRWHYTMADLGSVPGSALPPRTGITATC